MAAGNGPWLALRKRDGDWVERGLPEPPRRSFSIQGALEDVSCPNSSECLGVGIWFDRQNNPHPLVVTWSAGRWSYLTPPLPAGADGADGAYLESLSCVTATRCLASGNLDTAPIFTPLLERLTPAGWSPVRVPAALIRRDGSSWPLWSVSSVACSSRAHCVVAAEATDPAHPVGTSDPREVAAVLTGPLGGPWTVRPVPRPPGVRPVLFPALQYLTCPTDRFCAALERYSTGTLDSAVMLLDRGGRWSVSPLAKPRHYGAADDIAGEISAMTCPGAGRCVAVGYFPDASQPTGRIFAETLTGRQWTARLLPLPGGRSAAPLALLDTLACTPDGARCVTGGYWYPKPSPWTSYPLIDVIDADGHATAHSGPNFGPTWATRSVTSAACPAPDRCLVTGYAEKRPFAQTIPTP